MADAQNNSNGAAAAPAGQRPMGGGPARPGGQGGRPPFPARTSPFGAGGRGGQGGGRPGGPGGQNRFRRDKPKPEFDHKMIDVRRVARVVAGGRRFSFAVSIVAGDRKGKVGVGTGKGGDTASAIEKAMRSAKKNMITVKLNSAMSIPHEVSAKYASGRVLIKPAPGRGLVAGSSLRNVLDLAGVKDVNGKVISPSKNKLNIARATVEALSSIRTVTLS